MRARATYEPRQKVWAYGSDTDSWRPGRVIRTELNGIRIAVYNPAPSLGSFVTLYIRRNVRPRYDGQQAPEARP